jgi:hypothetical protein
VLLCSAFQPTSKCTYGKQNCATSWTAHHSTVVRYLDPKLLLNSWQQTPTVFAYDRVSAKVH